MVGYSALSPNMNRYTIFIMESTEPIARNFPPVF